MTDSQEQREETRRDEARASHLEGGLTIEPGNLSRVKRMLSHRMSASGPESRFAATQRYVCSWARRSPVTHIKKGARDPLRTKNP
jgi:hypothetical protein